MKFQERKERILNGLELLAELSGHDLRSGFQGAAAGTLWMLIRPLFTILVYFVVFQFFFGLSAEGTDAPYAIWFLAGMLPWLYFAETLGSGICCYREYSYLVKKILFPVRLVPMIRLLSGYAIHGIFMLSFFMICIFCNHFRRISLPVFFYAELCLVLHTGLLLKLGAILRSFFRDVSDFTGLYLQAGIWAVPILWEIRKVPASVQWIFACNPMFHVIQVFRQAMGCGQPGPAWLFSAVVFWTGCLILSFVSEWLFRSLKGHLPDVL